MKIAIIRVGDKFEAKDLPKLEEVKKELQDALDAETSVAVVLPFDADVEVLSYNEYGEIEGDAD